ncbi:MAG: hypothetical protein B7X47_06355 [Ferrovum sp. 34-44-207]|nr:MAG: hypothetical protein B7X47_06355 [Ferrovum sp. 34-44-207]
MEGKRHGLLLLAAGSSRRFGENKLLLKDETGQYLAIRVAELYAHLEYKWAAITSRQLALIEPLCRLGYQVTVLKDSPSFSYSLKVLVENTKNHASWLVALADMPCIQPTTVEQLMNCLQQGKPLVVPRYRGKRGNPVGFSRAYLSSDYGLREILENNPEAVNWLEVEDEGVVFDIDEPEHWLKYLRQGVGALQ